MTAPQTVSPPTWHGWKLGPPSAWPAELKPSHRAEDALDELCATRARRRKVLTLVAVAHAYPGIRLADLARLADIKVRLFTSASKRSHSVLTLAVSSGLIDIAEDPTAPTDITSMRLRAGDPQHLSAWFKRLTTGERQILMAPATWSPRVHPDTSVDPMELLHIDLLVEAALAAAHLPGVIAVTGPGMSTPEMLGIDQTAPHADAPPHTVIGLPGDVVALHLSAGDHLLLRAMTRPTIHYALEAVQWSELTKAAEHISVVFLVSGGSVGVGDAEDFFSRVVMSPAHRRDSDTHLHYGLDIASFSALREAIDGSPVGEIETQRAGAWGDGMAYNASRSTALSSGPPTTFLATRLADALQNPHQLRGAATGSCEGFALGRAAHKSQKTSRLHSLLAVARGELTPEDVISMARQHPALAKIALRDLLLASPDDEPESTLVKHVFDRYAAVFPDDRAGLDGRRIGWLHHTQANRYAQWLEARALAADVASKPWPGFPLAPCPEPLVPHPPEIPIQQM